MEKKKNASLVPALLAVVAVLLIVIVVMLLRGRDTGPAQSVTIGDGPPILAYAEGVTVVDDESALQDAVNRMIEDAEKEMVASYRPKAFSDDGTNFTCYIANSEYNEYDMYIGLYTDLEEDPLFLSGLMRPGQAFREVALTRSLDKGTHVVYLVFTQVEEDHTTAHGQSIVTLEMQVN